MKNNKKEKKEPFAIAKNFAYSLKIIISASPSLIPLKLLNFLATQFQSTVIMKVLFLKYLLEYIEQGRSFHDFMVMLLTFVAIRIACEIIDYVTDYAFYFKYVNVRKKLGEMIFRQAQRIDVECFETPEFYDNYKRAIEIITNHSFINVAYMFAEVTGGATVCGYLIFYISTIDAKVLIVLLSAIFVIIAQAFKGKVEVKKDKEMTSNKREKAYVQRAVFLREYSKDMRTSGIYSVMHTRFVAAIERNREIIKKYGWKMALFEMASTFFGEAFPVAGTYAYAVYCYAVKKSIALSDFSVMVTAVSNIKEQLSNVVNCFSEMIKQVMFFENLREFMKLEPKLSGGELVAEAPSEIEFCNVSFTYPGAEKASLNNVSFKITGGETVALVGKNGAGKTTLVKLIMRFYEPTDGVILYNGVDIREYSTASLRERIASVFQDFRVFALSVNENVLCRESENDDDINLVRRSLEKAGMLGKIDEFPNGADTMLTREFDNEGIGLSGGESQKVAAARMFARDFDMTILDEPSSALDPVAEHKMFQSLLEATKGKTVIYISHRLSSALLSDKIIMLEDGAVAETGTHAELMKIDGKYAEMFAIQASSYDSGEEAAV